MSFSGGLAGIFPTQNGSKHLQDISKGLCQSDRLHKSSRFFILLPDVHYYSVLRRSVWGRFPGVFFPPNCGKTPPQPPEETSLSYSTHNIFFYLSSFSCLFYKPSHNPLRKLLSPIQRTGFFSVFHFFHVCFTNHSNFVFKALSGQIAVTFLYPN